MRCVSLLSLAAAQESISSCKQDWSSVQSDFNKRFDTQLKQELSDQGSSITGKLAHVTIPRTSVQEQSALCLGGGLRGHGSAHTAQEASCRLRANFTAPQQQQQQQHR